MQAFLKDRLYWRIFLLVLVKKQYQEKIK